MVWNLSLWLKSIAVSGKLIFKNLNTWKTWAITHLKRWKLGGSEYQNCRKQRRISSRCYSWDGSLPAISYPYIICERFRHPWESLAGLLGSGAYPLARGKQETLNEYHTKIIHGGQSVVFQRKIKMLLPKEGGMGAGQSKTTDVHCSRSIWYVFDEPKDQKPCKDTYSTHTHTRTQILCSFLEEVHLRFDWLGSPFDSLLSFQKNAFLSPILLLFFQFPRNIFATVRVFSINIVS